jgi:hypothetical protein
VIRRAGDPQDLTIPLARSLDARSAEVAARVLVIPLVTQTTRQDPSGSVWTDDPSNVSRQDPSAADWADAEH